MQNILIVILCVFCLHSCAQTSNQNQIDNEDFKSFLSDFSSNEEFQKKRTSRQFVECEISIEGDSTCKTIIKGLPSQVRLLKDNRLQQIYQNFNLTVEDTNERVFAIEQVEGGSGAYYYFRRHQGKWFLVKRVVYL